DDSRSRVRTQPNSEAIQRLGCGRNAAHCSKLARCLDTTRSGANENIRANGKISGDLMSGRFDSGISSWRAGMADRRKPGQVSGRLELLRVVQPAWDAGGISSHVEFC